MMNMINSEWQEELNFKHSLRAKLCCQRGLTRLTLLPGNIGIILLTSYPGEVNLFLDCLSTAVCDIKKNANRQAHGTMRRFHEVNGVVERRDSGVRLQNTKKFDWLDAQPADDKISETTHVVCARSTTTTTTTFHQSSLD